MSTSFNPGIPTDQDSVYDAYWAFRKNVESFNNLINVDHYNGTSQSNHGTHRRISFPQTMADPTRPSGLASTLYTRTKGGVASLVFANSAGNWEIPLQIAFPEILQVSDNTIGLPSHTSPQAGYVTFKGKFMIGWVRCVVPPRKTEKCTFSLTFNKIFSCSVNYSSTKYDGTTQQHIFSFNREQSSNLIPPNYTLSLSEIQFANSHQTLYMSVSAIIIGERL